MISLSRKQIVFIVLMLCWVSGHSQNVTLEGKAIDYANDSFVFYTYSDLITKQKKELCNIKADSIGNFAASFSVGNTEKIFTDLGIFTCSMFVEPGKNYKIILPGKSEKEIEDIVNPYFSPVEIELGIENSDSTELNFNIRNFDDYYESLIRSDVILKREQSKKLDSIIIWLRHGFSDFDNEYFSNYMEFKFNNLKYISVQRDVLFGAREYFAGKPLLINNVAYMDFFNEIFTDFFSFYAQTEEGNRLKEDIIYAKSPSAIKETFWNSLALRDTALSDLIILKSIHDAFYTDNAGSQVVFPEKQLFQILDSVRLQSVKKTNQDIAKNIYDKVTYLKEGTMAPGFTLLNQKGDMVSLSDFKGKYVYLVFLSTQTYPCKQQIPAIAALKEKYGRTFEIVSIIVDEDFEKSLAYMKSLNYKWHFLSYGQNTTILNDYRVDAFPTYYFIDTEGKLAMSPAVSPLENFERDLYNYLKEQNK